MSNVRIIFMNPPIFMPDGLADFDGLYSLDLKEKELIAITRKIDDYISVGQIKQDTFREIEIPITKKNRLLIGQIGNPSALNENNNKIFDIQLICGDYSYPVQGLQVVGLNEGNNTWSCIIFGEVATWAADIRELKLNTLDLGSEVCDDNFVRFVLPDQHLYTDTSYPVFAPACNYGKHFINHNILDYPANSQMVFNSYRYWYSPLALMRALFCAVGYELIAPILETEEWRRTWIYLLDPEFETINQADIANRPALVNSSANDFFYSPSNIDPVGLDTIVNNPGNHLYYQYAGSPPYTGMFYSGGVIGNFRTTGTIRFQNPLPQILISIAGDRLTVKVTIRKSDRYGHNNQQSLIDYSTVLAEQQFVRTNPIGPGNIVNFNFDISTGDIKVYQHEVVFILVEITGFWYEFVTLIQHGEAFFRANSYLVAGASFELIPTTQVIEKGDTLNFASMIHKDYTGMDLVQGIAHLNNLKIETDAVSKKVYMYPEFKMDFPISGIQEAYFKDNQDAPLEVTDFIQVKSLEQGFLNTDLQRNVYLKFKDSTDGYIGWLNLAQELHSKRIDLGSEYENDENKIENPFFEPTEIVDDWTLAVDNVLFLPTYALKSVNIIPFLWESEAPANSQPQLGYNFTPRIAIAYEKSFRIEAIDTVGSAGTALDMFIYEDTTWAQANCFGQIYPVTPRRVEFYTVAAPSVMVQPLLQVVYGRGLDKVAIPDLYEMIYRKAINQAYFNISLMLMAKIDLTVFSRLSFRQKWHLVYDSAAWGQIDIYCRLSYIQDYVIGVNMPTPIELIPDSNNFINC